MSLGFFFIGGLIFAVYMYFNIFYSSRKSKEENYPNHDVTDYDGMGNYGRFPNSSKK